MATKSAKPRAAEKALADRAKELGLPELTSAGWGPIVLHLAERVVTLEKGLAALQKGVSHITSIPPIGKP